MEERVEQTLMAVVMGIVLLVMVAIAPTLINGIVNDIVQEMEEVEESIVKEGEREIVKEEPKEEIKEEISEGNQNKTGEPLLKFMANVLKVIAIIAIIASTVIIKIMFWGDIKKKIKKVNGAYKAKLKAKKYLGYSEYLTNKELVSFLGRIYSNGEYKDLLDKLTEINKVYLRDKDSIGVKMYKYGEVFTLIYKTLKEAKEEGVLYEEEIVNKVYEAVKYPYEDIVGKGLPGKLLEGLEKELRIQKELGKENSK